MCHRFYSSWFQTKVGKVVWMGFGIISLFKGYLLMTVFGNILFFFRILDLFQKLWMQLYLIHCTHSNVTLDIHAFGYFCVAVHESIAHYMFFASFCSFWPRALMHFPKKWYYCTSYLDMKLSNRIMYNKAHLPWKLKKWTSFSNFLKYAFTNFIPHWIVCCS